MVALLILSIALVPFIVWYSGQQAKEKQQRFNSQRDTKAINQISLIKCPTCSNDVSNHAASCPKCGHPIAPSPPPKATLHSEPKHINNIGCGTVLLGFLIFGIFLANAESCSGKKTSSPQPVFNESSALTLCQFAIKRVSRDPEKAEVPWVPGNLSGNDFVFSWGMSTKYLRLRNGLGLDVATSASCGVDKNTEKIKWLTIDGKTVF